MLGLNILKYEGKHPTIYRWDQYVVVPVLETNEQFWVGTNSVVLKPVQKDLYKKIQYYLLLFF